MPDFPGLTELEWWRRQFPIRDLVAECAWIGEFVREDLQEQDVSAAAFRMGRAGPSVDLALIEPPRWARVHRRWEAKHR